jgi:hypothetical protein
MNYLAYHEECQGWEIPTKLSPKSSNKILVLIRTVKSHYKVACIQKQKEFVVAIFIIYHILTVLYKKPEKCNFRTFY